MVDGGFSDDIPHTNDIAGVITVSPFLSDLDICLEEDRHHNIKQFFHLANMELQFNVLNWWRIRQCFFSPSMSELRDIQREGYRHTLRFLKTRGEGDSTHNIYTSIHVHTPHTLGRTHTHPCTYMHVDVQMHTRAHPFHVCMCALVCDTSKRGYL